MQQPSAAAAASSPSMPQLNFDSPSKIVGLNYSDDHVLHSLSLRFSVTPNPFGAGTGVKDTDDARRLISAVDAALALRSGTDMDDLEINFVYSSPRNRYIDMSSGGFYLFRHGHAADITSAHLAAWLRFAARHVTRRFILAVPVPPRHATTKKKTSAAAAPLPPDRKLFVEMLSTARSETMSLTLGNATLAVPIAGAFHVLADLHLSHARIVPTSSDEVNLSRLLSAASCPALRRLRLEHVAGLAALRLRPAAATLEELRLDHARDMALLEVDAPGLRSLHVADCYSMASDDAAATISAPRLETMACAEMCHPDRLRFDGAATVRRLERIFLWSHGLPGVYSNAGAVWLLRHCAAATSLGLRISPPVVLWDMKAKNRKDMEEMMSPVPQLPNITSLTIEAQWQHLEASIAKLIAKCSRLEHLTIDILRPCDPCSNPRCFCYQEASYWDDQKVSLEHLLEVKITGLRPSDDHLRLVRHIIASAPALEKMTVELHIGKDLDCSSIPCSRGHWAPCVSGQSSRRACNKTYVWAPGKKGKEGQLVVHPGNGSTHPLLFCSKTTCVLPQKRSNQDL